LLHVGHALGDQAVKVVTHYSDLFAHTFD